MIRKDGYRGAAKNVTPGRLKLPFDAMTPPGALFTAAFLHSLISAATQQLIIRGLGGLLLSEAANVLQTRGCPLCLQQTTLDLLEVLVHPIRDTNLDLVLLPGAAD